MGLDGVELIMTVEEEFKIAISDADAEQCVTVGNLVDLVHSRLRQNPTEPCPSQYGFYVVRHRLIELLGLKRSQIKPETRLEDLIGRTSRRKVWCQLVPSLTDGNIASRSLVRPRWMNFLVGLVIPAAACICLVSCAGLPFSVALLAAAVVGFVGVWLTRPFQREFPREFRQVLDLIKFVKTLDSRTWSKEEVFHKIRAITGEQLGVKESLVTLDARFVKDLGAG